MVIVTHELQSIFSIADRIIMLDKAAKELLRKAIRDAQGQLDRSRVTAFFIGKC